MSTISSQALESAAAAVKPDSTSIPPSPTARGKSTAWRAARRTNDRQATARGIMTLEASDGRSRFRLHAARREQLKSACSLLLSISAATPESTEISDTAHQAGRSIADLLRLFATPELPRERAENQLPVGDRT